MRRSLSRRTISSSASRVTLRIDAAQHVVGAELDDHRIGAVRHRPVEPRQPARGGVAGDARIGDLDREALGRERLLELGREGVVGRKPVAGGERIAERHDPDRPLGRRRRPATRQLQQCGHDKRDHDSARHDLDRRAPNSPYERGDAAPRAGPAGTSDGTTA